VGYRNVAYLMLLAQHQISNVVVTGRLGYRINGPAMLLLAVRRAEPVGATQRTLI